MSQNDLNQKAHRIVTESTAGHEESLPAELEAAWEAWSKQIKRWTVEGWQGNRPAQQTLRIIADARDDDAVFKRARVLLDAAHTVAFIGFGYGPTNLRRLAIDRNGRWLERQRCVIPLLYGVKTPGWRTQRDLIFGHRAVASDVRGFGYEERVESVVEAVARAAELSRRLLP